MHSQRLSSEEKKGIKLKMQGLKEGSDVRPNDQSYYDKAEIIYLIQLTRCFQKNKI